MKIANQTPEQLVRDKIDRMLHASGWKVQLKKQMNLAAGHGVAICEFQTNIGPADYILFVDKKPVGVIEAKREEEGIHLTMHEDQTEGYAKARLRLIDNAPLVFAYESTGEVTRFTDYRDPKPRSRQVFTFHPPETFSYWLRKGKSLRTRLHAIRWLTTIPGSDNGFPPSPPRGEGRDEGLQWLRMIKDYIANSFHVDREDFELDPFNKQGGLGKMWQLFGEQTDEIIKLNETLVA